MFKKHLGNFGRRIIHKELQKKGIFVSEYRITKILKDKGLRSKYGRKKGKNVHTAECTAKYIQPNLFAQLKEENRQNMNIWSMDFSEVRLQGKKYYMFGIVSVNSKKCIALNVSEYQNKEIVESTLINAIAKFSRPDIIMSDRGCQFVSEKIYSFMKSHKIKHSMSKPHKPVQNCYIETFWKTLKTEIGKTEHLNINKLKMVLQYYLKYYNYDRPHSSLNYTPPMKYSALLQNKKLSLSL